AFSYVDLHLGASGAEVRLTVHRKDAANALGLASPESLATEAGVAAHAPRLAQVLTPRLTLRADGHEVPIVWTGCAAKPERRAVEFTGQPHWPHAPGSIGVTAQISPENNLHETFVNVYQGDRLLRQEVLTHDKPKFDMYLSGPEGI